MKTSTIDELERKYNIAFLSLAEYITVLENRYLKINDASVTAQKENILPDGVIVPNEKYIEKLLTDLKCIKGHFGDNEYKKCEDGFTKILEKGDFEDGEEIIDSAHQLVEKYIYGSDTKVDEFDWEKLEKFIVDAGYVPVSVKAGDDISKFKTYFDRPILADGGKTNTIKHIQLKPFILKYYDGDRIQELKLCGKCTYYK